MTRIFKIGGISMAVAMAGLTALYFITGMSAMADGPGDTLGPELGTAVNTFKLPDSEGNDQDFASLSGKNGLVLVFTRSAQWCPFCKRQMADVNETLYDSLVAKGYNVAAVTYDSQEILRDFGAMKGIRYPLLSDKGSVLIKKWGLLNTSADQNSDWYGYPHPIIMIADSQGVLRAKLFEQSYRDRPSSEAVLEAIEAL